MLGSRSSLNDVARKDVPPLSPTKCLSKGFELVIVHILQRIVVPPPHRVEQMTTSG